MSQPGHQLELFSDSQEDPKIAANRAQRNSFVTRIWGYEKTVLIIILLFITGIISFSLGVEKSRRTLVSRQPVAAIINEPVTVEPPKKVESLTPPVDVKPIALKQVGQYAIQVASFKASSYAKKEAELLKKRGFKVLILNKGKYTILCVGNFPNKETAQPLLLELSKYYKSCYIRRL